MNSARSIARNLTRSLIETRVGGIARQQIMVKDAAAEQAFVGAQSAVAGVAALTPARVALGLRAKPSADTFFILGSGGSIEELTTQNFDEIGQQRSVGINNWPVHPFVPDLTAKVTV